MTKNDEIQALMELAHKLGSHSYCGPWLNDQIPFIEHDIRCDLMPTPTWAETRKMHDETCANALSKALGVIDDAKKEAKRIVEHAQKYAEMTRQALARDLQRALDAL
jgi:cell division septum initiation protein DivIVA